LSFKKTQVYKNNCSSKASLSKNTNTQILYFILHYGATYLSVFFSGFSVVACHVLVYSNKKNAATTPLLIVVITIKFATGCHITLYLDPVVLRPYLSISMPIFCCYNITLIHINCQSKYSFP